MYDRAVLIPRFQDLHVTFTNEGKLNQTFPDFGGVQSTKTFVACDLYEVGRSQPQNRPESHHPRSSDSVSYLSTFSCCYGSVARADFPESALGDKTLGIEERSVRRHP